ncbi:transcriptional regulator [Erysipelotrichaceae bacterium]|nr:transcriptional regulator [Erysipelotrichaceae bacterium]
MIMGEHIKRLRIEHGLTQEELANRSELTKGYISQIERDLSSPSIATLIDILEALGTTLPEFFNEKQREKIVFTPADWFEKNDDGITIEWVIPNAQKNEMEPILMTLEPMCRSIVDLPHKGEEFGFILSGEIELLLGAKSHIVKKGETFYFDANNSHVISNPSKSKIAKLLWVSTPPNF